MKSCTQSSGIITQIQRFSVHDGPGIRSTVFFKGCPLRCRWCHNPETHSPKPQLQYNHSLCIGCGLCADVCPHDCHTLAETAHTFVSAACTLCRACVHICPVKAIEICGKSMTAGEVISAVERDRPFYGSVGGITLSGGEPMMQPDFALAILKIAAEASLDACIETCGVGAERLDPSLCSRIYYDIKAVDETMHRALTGSGNRQILDNLSSLASKAADKITVRTVIVRGLTDTPEHIGMIAEYCRQSNIQSLELQRFHPYGASKAEAAGIRLPFRMGKESIPDDDTMERLRQMVSSIL